MKKYLVTLLSILTIFAYSCSGEENTKDNPKTECKTNSDCKSNEICNSEGKCETKQQENTLTSIEVDIENSSDAKKTDLLIGEKKTVKAYGIYNNNESTAEDISSKVRWYSSNSSVGTAKKEGEQIKFEAKNVGTTEIYCKYKGIESEHVIFNVLQGTVSQITLQSNIGNSIYLHQSLVWNIIATFEGGKQGKLDEESVQFHSNPEGLFKDEQGKYRFNATGNYDVWVTQNDIESNHLTIEVKDNIVTGLEINYDREEGDFIVNKPHGFIVKELYLENGESILEDSTGLEWSCETRKDNGDGTYTPEECLEGDYEINGFTITFKRVETFYMTVTKNYTENTECEEGKCSGSFGFIVSEAE